MMNTRIYFDYAATTPVDPEVFRAMKPYFSEEFGNPGSIHSFGQKAIAAMDNSREIIAKAIGAQFREIIFTGSATEANNLAIRGIIKQLRITDYEFNLENPQSTIRNPRIITTAIEHESVLETCRALEKEGVEAVYIKPRKNGIIDPADIEKALNERTALVSVMYANNEIGTVQPIAEIAKIISDFRERQVLGVLNGKNDYNERAKASDRTVRTITTDFPLFHTDAVQAFQFLDCNADSLGADFMTLSAHKIYGPKGVGALYINSKHEALNPKQYLNSKKRNVKPVSNFDIRISDLSRLVSPIVIGGGQEFGLRSGTENVPAIVGFGKAAELAVRDKGQVTSRIRGMRDDFWSGIKKIFPKAQVNGDGKMRLPNNLNVYFPGHNASDLLVKFDLAGIAVSSGSACRARSPELSYVLRACGMSKERVESSLRISFGRYTTRGEVIEALKRMRKIL